jgi:DNA-binding NarL/FixJ family response regulator
LRVLSQASREIILADTEANLLSAVCSVLIEHGGYRLAAVHYVEHDAEATMKLIAKAGVLHHYLDNVAVTWADTAQGQGPIGRAVRTGRPQVNQQFLTDPRMASWRDLGIRAGIHSSMSLPLKDAKGVFATLSVFAAESDAFDMEEVRLLDELASHLSFGIGSLLADRFASEHAELNRPGTESEEPDALARLSPREREVLKLVAEGRSSKEIAMLFGVAPTSVATYRSRIMFKLHVDDVTGLVRFAIRHGVIQA